MCDVEGEWKEKKAQAERPHWKLLQWCRIQKIKINGRYQKVYKQQVLETGGKGEPPAPWVAVQTGAGTMERRMEVPRKLKQSRQMTQSFQETVSKQCFVQREGGTEMMLINQQGDILPSKLCNDCCES